MEIVVLTPKVNSNKLATNRRNTKMAKYIQIHKMDLMKDWLVVMVSNPPFSCGNLKVTIWLLSAVAPPWW